MSISKSDTYLSDNKSGPRRPVLRFISAVVALSFFLQDVSIAAIDINTRSKLDPSSFYIPRNIGVVKEVNPAKDQDTIINIKDIHDNYGAQESIVQIMENLITNYNIKTIGVEAMQGYVDTLLLGALPDEGMRQNTARYLMQEGKLSAGEFLSAMSGGKIAVYGMDDNKLYEENLTAFKVNLKNKKENFERIEKLVSA